MTPQERDVLMPLLDRLRQTRAENKDAEADQLIRQTVQAQPDAPYVLAQTVLMQDYALHAAQDRIHALEQQLAQSQAQGQQQGQHASGGGFLSGLLGGRPAAPPPPPPVPAYGAPYAQPSYGSQIANAVQPGAGQPSFLRSAAQTAAGIAGGALLFQGMEGLFGGHGGGLLGGGGSGLLGGASGLLGGAGGASGLASVDNFADNAGANAGPNYDDRPFVDDQRGAQGGDVGGYADDTTYQADNSGQVDYADTGSDTGGDVGGDDFSAGDFGDDSLNS